MDQTSIKILICGVGGQTADFLKKSLFDEAYVFQYFEDIENAIHHLSPGEFQALLIGLGQQLEEGKLGGLKAIPIIKKIDPNLPIIAIAPNDSLEIERKARVAGIFYYLIQPLEAKEVRISVNNAIRKIESIWDRDK